VLKIIRQQESYKQHTLDLLLSELQSHNISFEDAKQSNLLKHIFCGQNTDWLEKHVSRCFRFNAEILKEIM
jgi:hypothetical protein